MAQNLQLDPKKRDYVLTSSGSPVPSDRVEEMSYFAISIPQGAWLYGDKNQGSKLYTLNNVKRTISLEQQISGFVTDAIERQVISTGKATAQRFENIEATRNGTSNRLSIIPDQTQLSDQINFVAV